VILLKGVKASQIFWMSHMAALGLVMRIWPSLDSGYQSNCAFHEYPRIGTGIGIYLQELGRIQRVSSGSRWQLWLESGGV